MTRSTLSYKQDKARLIHSQMGGSPAPKKRTRANIADVYPRLTALAEISRFEEWCLLKLTASTFETVSLYGWVLRHTNGFVFDAFVNDELQEPFFGFDLAEAINVTRLKRARSAIPVYETASITSIAQLYDALNQSGATVGIVRSWTKPTGHHAYYVEAP